MLSVDSTFLSGRDEFDYVAAPPSAVQDRLVQCAALPSEIIEQYQRLQVSALHGVFPEISRAWFTIDSALYIWDYIDGSDFCVYDELNEVIVGVGLVKPLKGVFREDVSHLLVLATPVMVHLIAVEFRHTDGRTVAAASAAAAAAGSKVAASGMHGSEMHIDADALFTAPTNNVCMDVITSTADGRIFMGGRDGNLYELLYKREDGWFFSKKCSIVNHSRSFLGFLVPSVLKAVAGPAEPIEQLVVDHSRAILYARTATSIRSFVLGAELSSGQQWTGQTRSARASYEATRHGRVISIHVIEKQVCQNLGLVAITDKGCRLYFVTDRYGNFEVIHMRVLQEQLATQRHFVVGHHSLGTTLIASSTPEEGCTLLTLALDAFHLALPTLPTTFVNQRMLVHPSMRELFAVHAPQAEIWCIQPVQETAVHGHNPLARQYVDSNQFVLLTSLGTFLYSSMRPLEHLRALLARGSDAEVAEFFSYAPQAPHMPLLQAQQQQQQQMMMMQQQQPTFFGFNNNNMGTPADVRRRAEAREACATCLIVIGSSEAVDVALRDKAKRAFMMFGGEPIMHTTYEAEVQAQAWGRPHHAPKVVFSGKLDGVYLHFGRLLRCAWNLPVAVRADAFSQRLVCQLEQRQLEGVVRQLSQLRGFLEESGLAFNGTVAMWQELSRQHLQNMLAVLNPRTTARAAAEAERQMKALSSMNMGGFGGGGAGGISSGASGRDGSGEAAYTADAKRRKWEHFLREDHSSAVVRESESFAGLHYLLLRCLENLHLLVALCESDFTAVTGDLNVDDRALLARLTFADLVTTEDGQKLAKILVAALLGRFSRKEQEHAHMELSRRLNVLCPTLHSQLDVLRDKANEKLQRAKSSPKDSKETAKEALELFLKLYSESENITGLAAVCKEFANLGFTSGVVTLALKCASAPHLSSALAHYRRMEPEDDPIGREALETRRACYRCITDTLQSLLVKASSTPPSEAGGLSEPERKMKEILNQISTTDDELAHVAIFDWYWVNQLEADLIRFESKYFESYLTRCIQLSTKKNDRATLVAVLELASNYYKYKRNYLEAAKVLRNLAESNWELDLQSRLQYLSEAVVCEKSAPARTVGQNYDLHQLEERMEVAQLQARVRQELVARLDRVAAGRADRYGFTQEDYLTAVQQLDGSLMDITMLHDEFTKRFHLHLLTLDLVVCAAVACNMEDLWRDVIEDEMRESTDIYRVVERIVEAIRSYRLKSAEVPLKYICYKLEVLHAQTAAAADQPALILRGLLKAGVSLRELFAVYQELHAEQLPEWNQLKRPMHLLSVICALLNEWANRPEDRGQLSRIAQDLIPAYLTELIAKQADPALQQRFRDVQSRITSAR
eukprot:m.198287 g.198287  ORF g.198287 m.198287 type:complete len:1360 (+) comp17674_c0_seq4:1-4080(+)